MALKEIEVIKWEEVISELPPDHPNSNLLNNLTIASQHLSKDNLDYVYSIDMGYGEFIIDKGSMFHIKNCIVNQNRFGKSLDDFILELGYTDDPLGLVVSNQVDVFTENKSFGDKNEDWYNIPLNSLNPGDFFGVFGYLDSVIDYNLDFKTKRDWYAIAGNISFEIAFPFHHGSVNEWIGDHYQLSARNKGNEISHYQHKIEFLKSYSYGKNTRIVYFPKHFLTEIPTDIKLCIENELFRIGWSQSTEIRQGLFQDTSIYDFIREQSSKQSKEKKLTGLKHDKKFLAQLINYLLNASSGKEKVLRPSQLDNNFISELLIDFKNGENTKFYFEDNKCFEPIPFIWEKLCNDKLWGIVSFFHLPIIHQYTIISPTELIQDLNSIFRAMKSSFTKFDLMEIDSIANVGGFYGSKSVNGNSANTDEYFTLSCDKKRISSYMNNNALIKRKILETYNNLNIEKINLNSRLFANLFLINYSQSE